jgi:hypothetical protein
MSVKNSAVGANPIHGSPKKEQNRRLARPLVDLSASGAIQK